MSRAFGYEHRGTKKAAVQPTLRDLAWAAGFLEGEGSFSRTGRADGTGPSGERVTASQNNREPLDRLAALFGGQPRFVPNRKNPLSKQPGIWRWEITGPRARGVAMTIYSLLSLQRRAQIRAAHRLGGG